MKTSFELAQTLKGYGKETGRECIWCGGSITEVELKWLKENNKTNQICLNCLENSVGKPH